MALRQVLHPFYIFQVFSVVLWSFENYLGYATCIFLISVVSIVSTLRETKQNIRQLQAISRFVCPVQVLRDHICKLRPPCPRWLRREGGRGAARRGVCDTGKSVPSDQLVVGDVIGISELHTLPCGAVLLEGDCIANESILTGTPAAAGGPAAAAVAVRQARASLSPRSPSPPTCWATWTSPSRSPSRGQTSPGAFCMAAPS
jgi:cation-transporting P-type ATPase 13A2